jgi:hypothetical protein
MLLVRDFDLATLTKLMFILAFSCYADKDMEKTESILKRSIQSILDEGIKCTDFPQSVAEFKDNRWNSKLEGLSVLVYPFCPNLGSLGNFLGRYFNEASCANFTGAHFINPRPLETLRKDSYNELDVSRKFFSSFPTTVVNPRNSSRNDVLSKIGTECACKQYCWSDSSAPWLKNTDWIGQTFRRALDSAFPNGELQRGVSEYRNKSDLTNSKNPQNLPLIPDVAIHYRCGDNLGSIARPFGYGLLSFPALQHLIPPNSKYIYILTDPVHRGSNFLADPIYIEKCARIVKWLFVYIENHFPVSTILISRGGNMFVDMARLALANTTVCSASTFCLFPAVAHNGSSVYFPVTKLIGKNERFPINDHFHWISEPLITDENFSPWENIEYALNNITLPSGFLSFQSRRS